MAYQRHINAIAVIVLLCTIKLCNGLQRELVFEHAIDSISGEELQWSERGTVAFTPRSNGITGRLDQYQLSPTQKGRLQLASDADLKYRVRVKSPNGNYPSVFSSVRACALLASGLKDNVELHFDDKGNVVGIHYFTESSSCDVVLEDDVAPVISSEFSTTVSVAMPRPGPTTDIRPIPPPNMPQDRQDQEGGEKTEAPPRKQEQTFFEKYWLYILLFVGYVAVSAILNPPQQPGAQAHSGRGGANQGASQSSSGGGPPTLGPATSQRSMRRAAKRR